MWETGRWRTGLGELSHILVTLGLVMVATAGLLRGLDLLPGYLQGEPRGVKRYRAIEEVERKLGERLFLPVYFPDTLQWPPSAVRLSSRLPVSVALTFMGREGSEERLFVYQTIGGEGSISPHLMSPGLVLQTTTVTLEQTEGNLSRIKREDGEIWHDLTWGREGRQMALRFKGSVEELLKMARSMGRSGP